MATVLGCVDNNTFPSSQEVLLDITVLENLSLAMIRLEKNGRVQRAAQFLLCLLAFKYSFNMTPCYAICPLSGKSFRWMKYIFSSILASATMKITH